MNYSHVFLTRPMPQAEELAQMIASLGMKTVVQPAFTYHPLNAQHSQPEDFQALQEPGPADLLLFTSPRAVEHGLSQLPAAALSSARVGAIGPATATALSAAGIRVNLVPSSGYTSEALLETLESEGAGLYVGEPRAFIIAAPGGRKKLAGGLKKLGWTTRVLLVYKSEPAPLDKEALVQLSEADGLLSIWTSANAIKALSQRLPPAAWFRICQGDWLVISKRLQRLARAYGPTRIHLASGPGNQAILSSLRGLS